MKSRFSVITAVVFSVFLMFSVPAVAQETEEPAPEQQAEIVVHVQAPVQSATETVRMPEKELHLERFDIKDVNGRLVHGKDLEGWIILFGFGTEKTADQSLEYLKLLTKSEPRAEGVLYVCVADTSPHNTPVLRSFVKKLLKKEYRKQIRILEESYGRWNITPAAPLEDTYLLVADMKADLFEMFGIADQKDLPHLFIMDGKYRLRGHFTEFNDEVANAYRLVLAERETDRQFALKAARRKKNVWKKYALVGGVALWLALKD